MARPANKRFPSSVGKTENIKGKSELRMSANFVRFFGMEMNREFANVPVYLATLPQMTTNEQKRWQ